MRPRKGDSVLHSPCSIIVSSTRKPWEFPFKGKIHEESVHNYIHFLELILKGVVRI